MIASHLYHQKPTKEKKPPTLLKYISQRSLAVLMLIALAVMASVGNKPSDKRKSGLSTGVNISQSPDQQRYLSPNPRQLFKHVVGAIKDAFNDPALIEYANEQGIDIPDSPTTPLFPSSQSPAPSKSPLDQSGRSSGY